MKYHLLSVGFVMIIALFFAQDVHGMSISGGGARPLHIGATDQALGDIVVSCTTDGEIAGPFSLGFDETPTGLYFTGNTNYTFTYEGDWNGEAFSAPTATPPADSTQLTITKSVPTCKAGDAIRFTGLHVKYAGNAVNKTVVHITFRATASATTAGEVVIDTQKPTLLQASYLDGNHDGIIDTVALRFDEPVLYTKFVASDWAFTPGSMSGLRLIGLQSVSENTVLLDAVADVRATGTHGSQPSIMLNTGATLTDAQTNPAQVGMVVGLTDAAAPTVQNAFMIDADNDGKFDQVEIDFSEETNAASMSPASVANLWSGNGVTITGGVVGAMFGSAIRLQLEEPASMKTGVDGITIHYVGGSTPLEDAAGNAVAIGGVSNDTSDTYPVLNEDVPPRIIAVYPADGATGIPTTGSFSVTFSEPMDDVAIGFMPNNKAASAVAWSEHNTKATWQYTNWDGGIAYTIYVSDAHAHAGSSALKKALVDSTVPNTFAFTVSATAEPPATSITSPELRAHVLDALDGTDAVTNNRDIILSLSALGATQMQVVNGVDFSKSAWVAYVTSLPWKLNSGNGTKTVCARFRNNNVTTNAVCDSITYDASLQVPHDISFTIDSDIATTNDMLVTLHIHALGAKWMKISNNASLFDTSWIPYATTKIWALSGGYGTKAVYIQFRSADDIESDVYSDSIVSQNGSVPGIVADIAQLHSGDLIKSPDFAAVYYYGSDLRRYTFPNQKVYESWYPDFSGIKTVSSGLLASIPLGGNMTVHPGTFLIKSPSIPKVYFVSPGGVLHPIKNETVAKKLFGSTWGSLSIDMGDAFMVNYIFAGTELNEDSVHPDGTILEAQDKRYYVESGALHLFNDTGFSQNGFQSRFLIRLPSKPNYTTGTSITHQIDTYSRFKKMQKNGTALLL